jgi:hypothetical protein
MDSICHPDSVAHVCPGLELLQRGATAEAIAAATPALDSDDLEDLDEAPDNEADRAGHAVRDDHGTVIGGCYCCI